ncbi:MAG: ribose-phosphate pyrophosphokinase [Oxalobacter sp.]|nr:ribose-phosphate pyrophosphokinase [Oxalobacter sp.]
MSDREFMIFSGNANPELAEKVAARLGLSLGKALVTKFSDGEVRVEINERVRGKDVFIIQSTCAPTNDNLMEIVLMADALKRASAERITACIPYFGYARQDRRPRSTRVAISARVVANMLESIGISRVIIMDVHAAQIQGFFDIPVDNIYASPILLKDIVERHYENLIVVSPDIGGVVRARALAERLGCELSIIDKRRPKPNESEVMNLIGSVEGKDCIIMDDIVDTAGTLTKAAEALKERGAKTVAAYCTHPVLSGPAVERIMASSLDELVVTDTIPLSESARKCGRIRQLSCDAVLAETLRRVSSGESVMSLFDELDRKV